MVLSCIWGETIGEIAIPLFFQHNIFSAFEQGHGTRTRLKVFPPGRQCQTVKLSRYGLFVLTMHPDSVFSYEKLYIVEK